MAEKIDNAPVPFWVSRTMWGATISMLASAAAIFGVVDVTPAEVEEASAHAVAIAGGVGGIIAIWGRITTRRAIRGTVTAMIAEKVIEDAKRDAVAGATKTATAEAKRDIRADAKLEGETP